MKALIFNSGLGSRLGELTRNNPKAMVKLGYGETIFARQLRLLYACGIRDFVVTTGPFAEQLFSVAEPYEAQGCSFEFVPNPVYDKTNYIYSMYLARDYLRGDDFLMIHGDLVFDAAYVKAVLSSEFASLGSVNAGLSLPEKDFKARIIDGEVREVSVNIFDKDCVAFQPFYKLSLKSMETWLSAIESFVAAGDTKVYAENAANTVSDLMGVKAFSYAGHFVDEVDTPEDLERVSSAIRQFDFEQQPVYIAKESGVELVDGFSFASASSASGLLESLNIHRPLVVTGSYFNSLPIREQLDAACVSYQVFAGFTPNPTYEQMLAAFKLFKEASCDSLISVGGGSAMDVAKCIKALSSVKGDSKEALITNNLTFNSIPHLAVPTTAGTGSESTHFAVCYIGGKKFSVSADFLQPDAVILDASNLMGLPAYQKKCTTLDALCQAIESYWSSRATERSRLYSAKAIPSILGNWRAYLLGEEAAAENMLVAANAAGKAINLTTTTAAHAMSYKISSLYGIPHGHAVAMCMPHTWEYLIDHGGTEIQKTLSEIAILLTNGETMPQAGLTAFNKFFQAMELQKAVRGQEGDIEELVASVNEQRLSNFPITIPMEEIERMYREIVMI